MPLHVYVFICGVRTLISKFWAYIEKLHCHAHKKRDIVSKRLVFWVYTEIFSVYAHFLCKKRSFYEMGSKTLGVEWEFFYIRPDK